MISISETNQGGSFVVQLRPARAVYLIAAGSRDGFRRAVREASVRWGGASEPIVEVHPDGTLGEHAGLMVQCANIDGVVNVDVPADVAERVAQELAEAEGGGRTLECVPVSRIDLTGMTRFTTRPADLGETARILSSGNGYLYAPTDAPLWQATAAGELDHQRARDIGLGPLPVQRAEHDYEIGEGQLQGRSLLERTLVSFSERQTSPALRHLPTVMWITRRDELADCVGFWNVRALRPRKAASMPVYLLPADIEPWKRFPGALRSTLRLRDELPSPEVLLTSATLEREALDAFAETLGLVRDDDPRRRAGRPRSYSAPTTYTTGDPLHRVMFPRTYGEAAHVDVPVLRERITLSFPNPVALAPGVTDMAALVSIAGPPLDMLPRRTSTARLLCSTARWRDNALELAEYIDREWRLELNLPTPEQACRAVLAERTRSYRIGQKASVGLALMNPDALAALQEGHVYEAIGQLTTQRVIDDLRRDGEERGALSAHQQDLLARLGGRLRRAFARADRMGLTTDAALGALEHLVAVGWAERGLATKCAACGLESFVPLSTDTARDAARCPVCGTASDYIRNERGLAVHYRLDARVDHASAQGVIAHLLVIGALARDHGPAWLLPGVDLEFEDGTARESDLFGVCDKRLVCGEVKMSGAGFTEEQIDKDLDIAVRLGVDLHVMAAATAIAPETRQLAEHRFARRGIEVLILQGEDMRA
ncbi:MAG TPA: hypothetical protein VFU65_00660 [Actinocrinis sp.]|nr:hypothetical protein [Actinocrinis sp.]